jgi:cellulose synthase operon protein YhjQ
MKGGVGKTSTTANLSAALAQTGAQVVALDLDPQNSLHLHFGIATDHTSGACQQSLQAGADWADIALPSQFGVHCIPYGPASEEERIAFEELLEHDPNWIGRHLAEAGLDQGVVLIDTPPGPTVYLRQAFACADLILIVLLADAASFLTIPAMESWLHDMAQLRPELPSMYVLNQIDTASTLRRDVAEILRHNLGERLAPIGIHSDEAVGEALAFQQPVLEYDPHCQATHDLQRLAAWLSSGLT